MTSHPPNEQAPNTQPQQPTYITDVLQGMQAVNEQLVLAGLREQALTDQLRRQLTFTSAITTSLGEGVYVLDTTGRCTFVNPAAERMFGRAGADLHGKSIDVILPVLAASGTARPAATALILDVLHSGTTYRDNNAMFVHHDGSVVPVAYVAAPITIDGHVGGAVITFRDMTDVRRLQQIREEYISLISHDLRAPLTAILGRAEILLRRLTQQGLLQDANSARVVVESGHRMNDMITDMLDRSRADTHANTMQQTATDLVTLVQQMVEQTVSINDRPRVTLDVGTPLLVVIDVTQIERVVVNLLTNALKFSAAGSPISVRVTQHDSSAIVAVADAGLGIAPEDLSQLFEKHYRAGSVGHIAGNGLGLYGSRLIVEAHGGQIWVKSLPGQGSTFTIALPLP